MTQGAVDARALDVLGRALHATSRLTRLRAVSMLACVACPNRIAWLEAARADTDADVAATATIVLSWAIEPPDATWPKREDPRFDSSGGPAAQREPWTPLDDSRWQWEYVVEIWREDGLLVGSYLTATCEENDEHARRVALGQAILANAGGRGDEFDAATAAAFIVGKRRLPGGLPSRGRRGSEPGTGHAV